MAMTWALYPRAPPLTSLPAACQGRVGTLASLPSVTVTRRPHQPSQFFGSLGALAGARDPVGAPQLQERQGLRRTVHRGASPAAPVAFLADLSAPAAQAAKWVLRLVSFYALLRLGVAKEAKGGAIDNAQSFIVKRLFGDSDSKKEKDAKRAASKWKESTKGTLVRKLRVPSASQGRKLLNSIAGVLAEDDLFVDVASHKGCQVRRESAHSESVCCYNVRALFDELPTPHLEVEITVFPAGPLTSLEYQKAQKLENVLRKGNSI